MDKETAQVLESSEGELSDSEQEGLDSPELDQLVLIAEEQFRLLRPTFTKSDKGSNVEVC